MHNVYPPTTKKYISIIIGVQFVPLRRKTFKVPFLITAYFIVYQCGHPDGTRNIQVISDLSPHFKHAVGYCSRRVPYADFQQLKIVVFYVLY
jgi:hypothetical protein